MTDAWEAALVALRPVAADAAAPWECAGGVPFTLAHRENAWNT